MVWLLTNFSYMQTELKDVLILHITLTLITSGLIFSHKVYSDYWNDQYIYYLDILPKSFLKSSSLENYCNRCQIKYWLNLNQYIFDYSPLRNRVYSQDFINRHLHNDITKTKFINDFIFRQKLSNYNYTDNFRNFNNIYHRNRSFFENPRFNNDRTKILNNFGFWDMFKISRLFFKN